MKQMGSVLFASRTRPGGTPGDRDTQNFGCFGLRALSYHRAGNSRGARTVVDLQMECSSAVPWFCAHPCTWGVPSRGECPGTAGVVCAFCTAGHRHPCSRLSDASSRGEGALSLCPQPHVPSRRVSDSRSGHDPREREPAGTRRAGLADISPVCFGIRGTDFTENLSGRVRRLLCQRASVGTSSESMERKHERRLTGACVFGTPSLSSWTNVSTL
jgi:hypothetical protein